MNSPIAESSNPTELAKCWHCGNGRGGRQGCLTTPSEVAQALRSAAASGSYIAEPNLRPANSRKGNSFLERIWDM